MADWTRRNVVGGLALGAVFFGVEALAGSARRTPPSAPVPVPEEMLARMRALNRDGVVFVLPADPAGRDALGAALEALLGQKGQWGMRRPDGEAETAHARSARLGTLVEVVYGIASAKAVGARRDEQVVLVDVDGGRLAGGPLDTASVSAMVGSLRVLLDQQPFARDRYARHSATEVRALRGLLMEPGHARWPGWQTLDARIEAVAPALVEGLVIGTTSESGQRLNDEILRSFQRLLSTTREVDGGVRAVHGVTWSFDRYDPCPTCGMGSAAYTRTFLDFVSEED